MLLHRMLAIILILCALSPALSTDMVPTNHSRHNQRWSGNKLFLPNHQKQFSKINYRNMSKSKADNEHKNIMSQIFQVRTSLRIYLLLSRQCQNLRWQNNCQVYREGKKSQIWIQETVQGPISTGDILNVQLLMKWDIIFQDTRFWA